LGNGPTNLVVEGKKRNENHGQREKNTHKWVMTISEEVEHVRLSGSEEKLRKQIILGARTIGQCFLIKLINEAI
jgi:hypothetical protein